MDCNNFNNMIYKKIEHIKLFEHWYNFKATFSLLDSIVHLKALLLPLFRTIFNYVYLPLPRSSSGSFSIDCAYW